MTWTHTVKAETLRCEHCAVPVYASSSTKGGWRARSTPQEDECGYSPSGFHEAQRPPTTKGAPRD